MEASASLCHGALVCGCESCLGVRGQRSPVPGAPGDQMRIATALSFILYPPMALTRGRIRLDLLHPGWAKLDL